MTDTEKLLMVYGSIIFCRMQYMYNEDVMDGKKTSILTNQMEVLQKRLEALPFEELLQCGQKDFYSFL
jgi:hypothetical protein